MMNQAQAKAYGKKIGCKYYVRSTTGGLFGGFTTLESAQNCKKRWEEQLKNDPWNKGVELIITKH